MDISTLIMNGTYDSDLDTIADAVRHRQSVLRDVRASITKASLNTGDSVRLSGLRPAYINGKRGIVVEVKRSRVAVRPAEGQAQGRFSGIVTVPLSCVEKVEV
jgi:predicted metal-dependent RNase